MVAFEFESSVKPDGTLSIPPEMVQQLPAGLSVRVIVLADENRIEELEFLRLGLESFMRDDAEEDADWARLTHEQFFRGYKEDCGQPARPEDGPVA
ncbi:MAG: hypothetical protein K2R98_05035 [Gemmataceae bacterium]|nr:hypothetical protein [Gemmataceae bacterium]